MTTEKEKMNIDELLVEIGRTPLLSAEEELALIKAIQEQEPARRIPGRKVLQVPSSWNLYQSPR